MTNKKALKIIGASILVAVLLFLIYAAVVISEEYKGGEWQTHSFPEYRFRDSQTKQEFKDWLAAIPKRNFIFEDYDLCYMPWNDTIWDLTYRHAVDTFNLRLHTHRSVTNLFRTEGYYATIKGICRINLQWIYLYDDTTINRYFIPKNHKRKIRSFLKDNHTFLQWYDDEDVYIAHATDHIRPIDTRHRLFYEGHAIFFDANDFSTYESFRDVIERDSFYYRHGGPYMVIHETDTLSAKETDNNFEEWIVANMPTNAWDSITQNSHVAIFCKVDTAGNFSYENYSTPDLEDDVARVCEQLPKFVPAMVRGVTVNSQVVLRYYPYYDTNRR